MTQPHFNHGDPVLLVFGKDDDPKQHSRATTVARVWQSGIFFLSQGSGLFRQDGTPTVSNPFRKVVVDTPTNRRLYRVKL